MQVSNFLLGAAGGSLAACACMKEWNIPRRGYAAVLSGLIFAGAILKIWGY